MTSVPWIQPAGRNETVLNNLKTSTKVSGQRHSSPRCEMTTSNKTTNILLVVVVVVVVVEARSYWVGGHRSWVGGHYY